MVTRSHRLIRSPQQRRTLGPTLSRTALSASICACLALGDFAAAQESSIEEVVITGSRIVRRDLNAPSPILTVDNETFEQNSSPTVWKSCSRIGDRARM